MSIRLWLRRLRFRLWPPRYARYVWLAGRKVKLEKEKRDDDEKHR